MSDQLVQHTRPTAHPARSLSPRRRDLVAGVAWTVPAIAGLIAAPAAAASTHPKPVDGCIELVGEQPPQVDCNLRHAPQRVTIRALYGSIPAGTAVTLSFDAGLIAVRFTDGSVTSSGTNGTIIGLLTSPVAAGSSVDLPLEVTRAARRGGSQRASVGWKDPRGWASGCSTATLDASLQTLPTETATRNNTARRVITVR